jgi:catechol-2,3-dioxygenase
MVQIQALGHVVLKVSELHRSEAFYSSLFGMRIISRNSEAKMTFFSFKSPGIHHDFALIELGQHVLKPECEATGLGPVAFKVGESVQTLSVTRNVLNVSGTPVLYEAERTFSKCVHVLDPDGEQDRAVRRHLNVPPERAARAAPSVLDRSI